jgi:hypothetical protein
MVAPAWDGQFVVTNFSFDAAKEMADNLLSISLDISCDGKTDQAIFSSTKVVLPQGGKEFFVDQNFQI